MFNISGKKDEKYGEIPQTNPMRWTMLYRKGDKDFECQTSEIKCKDFFNDTVAYLQHGVDFNMYGYSAKKQKNKEGLYFLLTHIGDMASFLGNIEVLNVKLTEQLGCRIEAVEQTKTSAVVMLPNEVLASTWRMSLVTMLIRCCNYGVKYECWDDFYRTDAPMNHQERAFDVRAKANTQKWGFVVPEKYQKYWFYAGEDYNSEKKPKHTGGIIHNNGCTNWSYYMDCVLSEQAAA